MCIPPFNAFFVGKLKQKTIYKTGKLKRHKFKKKLGNTKGFGRPWKAPYVLFRIEFNYTDKEGNESNEQTHWIQCRKLTGEDYNCARRYFNDMHGKWKDGETIESKYVYAYICKYLNDNTDKLKINNAFIYIAPKINTDVIRQPIYHLSIEDVHQENLEHVYTRSAEVTFKDTIYHLPREQKP